jgi:hypothetical protein
MKAIAVTPEAVANGRREGLSGDIAKRIARMARRSAPVTHECGNRRFHDFVLHVADGRVLDITRLDTAPSSQ